MAKIFLLIAMLVACGHEGDAAGDPEAVARARVKAEAYARAITDAAYVRCDTLAFKPYMTVAGYPQDLSGFEDKGKWSRDITSHPPCYPTESSGTISFDGMVAVLHHAWTVKDTALLDRLIGYGTLHGWRLGEGEFANQLPIGIIAIEMRTKLPRRLEVAKDGVNPLDALKGFRGHLLASYIWLQGRMNGGLNNLENEALRALVKASPDDPMYLALWDRFNDGDQSKALAILLDEAKFPSTFPTETGIFGWGSAPASVYYLMTLAIIENK